MKKEQIAIIIPIYNLWKEMTLPCLLSLAQHSPLENVHIYLIDNGSIDVSADEILDIGKNLFADKFTYHRFDKNQGFAIACNYGAKLAHKNGDEFIFLLNNDTLVTANWLPPLLRALDDPKIGAVGPLLLFPHNQKVQHCGASRDPLNGFNHIYVNFPAKHPLVLKKRYLHYITGAAFLIKTAFFMELGMLCEEYLNGLEDLDLCCRITDKGYWLQVATESVLYHYEGQSEGRKDMDAKNYAILKSRNPNLIVDDSIIAKKDGYIPSLTKELQYYHALPQEKADQYTKAMKAYFSPQACEKLLEKEPRWIEGYHILAKYYDEQNMESKALTFIGPSFFFCPKLENYAKAISLLIKYGHDKNAAQLQQVVDKITRKANDVSYQKEVEQRLNELAQKNPIYKDIYASRLK